ncbi:MAG: phosphoadenylyl-sulfate reductase [Bauldia sp.]|uniref:phosphoadenylyl-sulfate reductase n=1 Tax=Bauldia sp. TaxID=2575872 RepID=UPI001D2D6D9D|nr:phosphoadenylyl-sulfate reductase [Bauldia sp.]MCB1495051.1 phosphoadenylyl-sulfate reductase [Bauldia sp.]
MAPRDAIALAIDPDNGVRAEAAALNARHGDLEASAAVELAVTELFPGKVALVSSFGAESAVLLHLVAEIDRKVPVIFLDTGRLFAETLEYRTKLVETLGLGDVRTVTPDPQRLVGDDPHRALWMTNPDLCCHIRKTEPLKRAVRGFDAWFTGRKRFQNAQRARLSLFEAEGTRIKINPLASWTASDLKTYALRHQLPEHPLVAKGYPSIGCVPCTGRVSSYEDQRSGRWRGLDKTECGIHAPLLETDGSGI